MPHVIVSYEEKTFIFLLLNEVSNFRNKKSINIFFEDRERILQHVQDIIASTQ
jgi:hypothetical protein